MRHNYVTITSSRCAKVKQAMANDKIRAYEVLKKDLKNGELTDKGFDAKVKKLLAEKTEASSKDFLSAAEAFCQAQKMVHPRVKKKQYPLSAPKRSSLKIRMLPMEWKARTSRTSGRYQKRILEEAPPRIVVEGKETYTDLLKIGKNTFWPDSNEGWEFTLCNSDGTRWSQEDFQKEYSTVADIKDPWKRTIYIGRRELEVIIMDEESSVSDETPEIDGESHPGCTANQEYCADISKSGRASKKSQCQDDSSDSSVRTGGAVAQGVGVVQGSEGTSVGTKNSGRLMVFPGSLSMNPVVPSLYLPRVPYVDKSLIKYNEENLLGEGSFGKVYGGSFRGTPAAVKKVVFGSAGQEDKDIQHEINVSLRLCHPNVVRLMAAARTESCFLLANEYIHGATLDDVLHRDNCSLKLEGDDADFIALELSMAIEYIHAQNIIHQDLKPANVMVHEPSKKAILTDWGLANIRDTVILRQGSRFTAQAVGPTGGTYLYMAPECLLHFEDASWQTDIWSLGATYLELFTRSVPWIIKSQRQLAALMDSSTPPHALTHLSERYSFLRGLVNYDPSSRPTASDVVHFLTHGLELDLEGHYGYRW